MGRQAVYCENCGAKLEDGSKFCEECGSVVMTVDITADISNQNVTDNSGNVKEVNDHISFEDDFNSNNETHNEYCKYCGSKIDNDAVFCSKCGKQIDNTQEHTSSKVDSGYSRLIICAILVSIVILAGVFAIYKVLNTDPPAPQYTQKYSDEVIAQKALNTFSSKMKSRHGGGVETIYHGASVDSSAVEFDPYTNKYTCTLNATYTTNILDFFGTSSTSYVVKAVYYDTGSELITEEFRIS